MHDSVEFVMLKKQRRSNTNLNEPRNNLYTLTSWCNKLFNGLFNPSRPTGHEPIVNPMMKDTIAPSPTQDDQSDTSTDPGIVVIEFNDFPTAEVEFMPIEAHSTDTPCRLSDEKPDIQSVKYIENIPPEIPAPLNFKDFEQILTLLNTIPPYILPHLQLSHDQKLFYKQRMAMINHLFSILMNNESSFTDNVLRFKDIPTFHAQFRIFFFKLLYLTPHEMNTLIDDYHIEENMKEMIRRVCQELYASTETHRDNPIIMALDNRLSEYLGEAKEDIDTEEGKRLEFQRILAVLSQPKMDINIFFYYQMAILFDISFKIIQNNSRSVDEYKTASPPITLPIYWTEGHYSISDDMFITPRDGNCFFHTIMQYLTSIIIQLDQTTHLSETVFVSLKSITEISDLEAIASNFNLKIRIFELDQECQYRFKASIGDEAASYSLDSILTHSIFVFPQHLEWHQTELQPTTPLP